MKALQDYIQVNGRVFLVSTINSPDHGWETLIFHYGEWRDLRAWYHQTQMEAIGRHIQLTSMTEDELKRVIPQEEWA